MKLIQSVATLKILQHNFPKMREGGGSKAVWNFSENSSVLEGVGFPLALSHSKLDFLDGVDSVLRLLWVWIQIEDTRLQWRQQPVCWGFNGD